jgi:hypothetical protein
MSRHKVTKFLGEHQCNNNLKASLCKAKSSFRPKRNSFQVFGAFVIASPNQVTRRVVQCMFFLTCFVRLKVT